MNYQDKTKDELIKELQKLQLKYDTLKASYSKDTTERMQAEEALLKSHDLLDTTFDSLNDALFILDDKAVIVKCNHAASLIFGYRQDEMQGQTTAFLHVDESALAEFRQQLYSAIEAEGRLDQFEFRMKRKDGTIFATEHSVLPLAKFQSRRSGWVSVVRDITDRKQLGEVLMIKNQVFEDSIAAMSIADSTGTITHVNQAFLRLWGYPGKEQVIGNSIGSFFNDPANAVPIVEALASHDAWEGEFLAKRADGTTFISRGIATSLRNTRGELIGYQSTNLDVTKEREAEAALREREEMIGAIVESSQDWIWAIDRTGRHTYSNRAVESILGYSPAEFQGMGMDLLHPDDKRLVEAKWPGWVEQRRGWQCNVLRWRTKDGSYRHLESTAVPILDPQGDLLGFRGVDRDITARRMAEEKLIEMHEQLQLAYSRQSEVVEDTRKAISREIHDQIGQSLSALMIDLDWIHSTIQEPETIERIDEMTGILNETINKVQKISSDLRPDLLDDLGLTAAMEFYIQEFEKRTGIKCHFKTVGFQYPDEKINIVIYRLLQESLTNVMRHAKAQNAYINVFQSVDLLTLEVVDDGTGFDPKKLYSRDSLGLIGMRERIKPFNGTLEIISARNKGARLIFKFPVK